MAQKMPAMSVSVHLTHSGWAFASCVMWNFYSAHPQPEEVLFETQMQRMKHGRNGLLKGIWQGYFMTCKLGYIFSNINMGIKIINLGLRLREGKEHLSVSYRALV